MSKNPWNRERLEQYLLQEESYQLEFKSSRDLCEQSINKIDSFFDALSADVSAFLNADGGVIVLGIDEHSQRDKKRAGIAEKFSDGCPRSLFNAGKVSNKICDRIHPSSGSFIQIYPVVMGQLGDEDLLAFVIDVKPGITAYQAPDKRYYIRRSAGIEPMEDKDIRLRMLTDRMARVSVSLKPDFAAMRLHLKKMGGPIISGNLPLTITLNNSGLKTIRRVDIKLSLHPRTAYLTDRFARLAIEGHAVYESRSRWPPEEAIDVVLHPDDEIMNPAGSITVERDWEDDQIELIVRVSCYLEDAPSVTAEFEFSDAVRAAKVLLTEASAEATRQFGKELGDTIRRLQAPEK